MKRIVPLSVIALIAQLIGCATPYRTQTTVSPSLDVCRYKTYTFSEPDDLTKSHWLSDPRHRKSLEDLMRHSLGARKLQELPPGNGEADLKVGQRLESIDQKFVRWTVGFTEGKSNTLVWSTQMEAVIADMEGKNLSHAREGLRAAFAEYPKCRK